jgi:uncharacterized protein YceH (UPF0502 family)
MKLPTAFNIEKKVCCVQEIDETNLNGLKDKRGRRYRRWTSFRIGKHPCESSILLNQSKSPVTSLERNTIMDILLSSIEVRVLGSLVEKELTTPEYYPLSLNSLVAACNQKSNRDPVMSLSEDDVSMAVETLRGKNLAWQLNTAGGRVPKFEHNLPARLKVLTSVSETTPFTEDTSDSSEKQTPTRTVKINLMRRELAVLTALMLRGPLTAGELRGTTGRIFQFTDSNDLEQTLQKLIAPENGPLVTKLPRQAGMKEQRYAHLFSGEVAIPAGLLDVPAEKVPAPQPAGSVNDRFAVLEKKVDMLAEELAALKQAVGEIKKLLE